MKCGANIAIIDADSRRRAGISHALGQEQIHVEPYENVTEIMHRWPRAEAILAHDDGETIAALVAHMARIGDWLPVIGFSSAPVPHQIVEAVLAGAVDYLAWPFNAKSLSELLERASVRAESSGNQRVRESMARGRIERLTRREREVLVCVASGLSNRLIGDRLAISPRTVEIHRANMLTKVGAGHTSEAIRIAIDANMV